MLNHQYVHFMDIQHPWIWNHIGYFGNFRVKHEIYEKSQGRCQDIRMNINDNESYLSTFWVPPTSAVDLARSKVSARVMECLVSVPSLLKCKCPKNLLGLETPECYKESALKDVDRKKWCQIHPITFKYSLDVLSSCFFLWNFSKDKDVPWKNDVGSQPFAAEDLERSLGSELQDHFGWTLQWPAWTSDLKNGTINVDKSEKHTYNYII